MKHRLLILAASCLLSTSALAATGDWSGWYVGIHAGHASGDADTRPTLGGAWSSESQALRDEVVDGWSASFDPSDSTYGVQIGMLHQFANGFVLGGELDHSQLHFEESRATGPVPTTTFPSLSYDFGNTLDADSKLSLRGRFGYASGRHLFYLTGGWARVDVDAVATVASNGNYLKRGAASESLDGTEFGAGYEFDFGNQWSLRAEYLRTNVDDLRFDTAYVAGSAFVDPPYTESFRQDLDFDAFRIGLSYRF
ncbi:MAG TPA: outer membrane beta-barrel protein [Arenimonas sp.]|uniref:outer membrane protein n=1 Tax=Arenimonas sp. TaxID=1872635 RepID=UPI002D802531|nr:outer membrane beta-barrel protein [Arenimonas sp.]HEU0153508.1 outer membrane beta-barrel protein [Arenimonas sp.]